ncbi:N-acetylglucosamine-6-O-sulfatase [subsurface metagenome]
MRIPNIDRLASEGVIAENVFCTNSICVPSRATILTGQYSHINGAKVLSDSLPSEANNTAKMMQQAGYQTAIVGKWHLKSKPAGFDYFEVLRAQGQYINPILYSAENFESGGRQYDGHSSDIIVDLSLEWLTERKHKRKPFILMTHFKSVHEPFYAAQRHLDLFTGDTIPEPEDLLWRESPRGKTCEGWPLEILQSRFLNNPERYPTPALQIKFGQDTLEARKATYQKFVRNYLQGVASIDEGVGRLIEHLQYTGELDNTIVIYTSDQGYFLGEHNMFDKRFMYEESLRMPFIVRYPDEIPAGSKVTDIITNVDFAPLLLDFAGLGTPSHMQGRSFRENLSGRTASDWPKNMYYRYWTDNQPVRPAHLGIRTRTHKLIYFYGLLSQGVKEEDCWELYDLANDPNELQNIYLMADETLITELKEELIKIRDDFKDYSGPIISLENTNK